MNIIKIIISFIVVMLAMILASFKPVEDKVQISVQEILDLPTASDLISLEVERIKEEQAHAERLEELEKQKREESKNKRERVVSRGTDRGVFTATAYDLSVASCGKSESHPAYGITANGTDLKGHTLESARAIAVDPKVIKLGSTVYVEFLDEEYNHLTGEFQAVDTGGAIKGSKIDVFFGDTGDSKTSQDVWDFGRRKVRVTILENIINK